MTTPLTLLTAAEITSALLNIVLAPPVIGEAWDTLEEHSQSAIIDEIKLFITTELFQS